MTVSGLISIVVVLLIVGLLLWALQQVPIDATIKNIIRVVVIVAVVIWLLSSFLGSGITDARLW